MSYPEGVNRGVNLGMYKGKTPLDMEWRCETRVVFVSTIR
jgi:hypothetical protein